MILTDLFNHLQPLFVQRLQVLQLRTHQPDLSPDLFQNPAAVFLILFIHAFPPPELTSQLLIYYSLCSINNLLQNSVLENRQYCLLTKQNFCGIEAQCSDCGPVARRTARNPPAANFWDWSISILIRMMRVQREPSPQSREILAQWVTDGYGSTPAPYMLFKVFAHRRNGAFGQPAPLSPGVLRDGITSFPPPIDRKGASR